MYLNRRTTDRRCRLTIVMIIAMSSAAGCGQGTSDIQGRVTYQGKPVVFGGVIVVDGQDKTVSARIDPEGHYVATGVGTGPLRFAIVSPNPAGAVSPKGKMTETKDSQEPGARATPSAAAPKSDLRWRPLPKQYEKPETSGIATTVRRGVNTFDIDIK